MLKVSGLSVSYGRHRALDEVSLSVSPGEIVVILGANGAGKSSLLKSVAGLVRPAPDSEIRLGASVITNLKPNEIVELGLSLVPEGRGIFRDLTVAENLSLGAYARRARALEAQHLVEVFDLFPRLKERRRQVARTMSGGEQQMVAIGRALMSNPSILMLDEPSLGLAPLLCGELFKALDHIRGQRVGILLVEQNAMRSLEIADRGYLLANGRVTGSGVAADLREDETVQRAYLGHA
jgi:branched-chain amino acid transport system ATP-binding protein